MRQNTLLTLVAASALASSSLAQTMQTYNLVQDFSGQHFFDGWDFYGYWDNLTAGNVNWVDKADATSLQLAYINNAGNAIIKVDNTTNVALGDNRNTVRITTQALYDLGSVWLIDMLHIPFGCSVWPAYWTKGPLWPDDGEIDIVEAVNLMAFNQMALHTTDGCQHTTPQVQLGNSPSGLDNCATGSGCTVQETKPSSYGADFATNGGGVWATLFDTSGIFIWYWPRAAIPPSIQKATATSATLDSSDWGQPSAAYPNTTCDIPKFFTAQQVVIDITLCGVWAGIDGVYNCGNGPTGLCYNDTVVGPGDKFNDAYFEIQYFRAYTTGTPSVTPTPTALVASTSAPAEATVTGTASHSASPSSNAKSAAPPRVEAASWALMPFLIAGGAIGAGLVLL